MSLMRLSVILVAIGSWYVGRKLLVTPPLPHLNPDPWWGPGKPREVDSKIRPFKIDIPNKDVEDLKARLSLSPRLTPPLEGANFTYGMSSTTLSVLLRYWQDSYDWRRREAKLNAFKHFKTRIEGLDLHFLRASPAGGGQKKVVPLLLVHGWPGSFVEFVDLLPLLVNPRQGSDVVFDVVCPSLPGYGFSEGAAKPGMNPLAMAQMFKKLMARLGYEKFYMQGGDWGSAITLDMATAFPDNVLGMHVNGMFGVTPGMNAKIFAGAILPSGTVMDPVHESKWYPLSTFYGRLLYQMGYAHLHATKPDTVGVALNTSPQGLAAYILEKFSEWTVPGAVNLKDGGLLDPNFPISLDALLDNICIYWFSSSIQTSIRLYSEFFCNPDSFTMASIPVTVPAGVSVFPDDLVVLSRNLAAHKLYNILTYTHPEKGGHFAAMEVPAKLAADIHEFVNAAERFHQQSKHKKTKA